MRNLWIVLLCFLGALVAFAGFHWFVTNWLTRGNPAATIVVPLEPRQEDLAYLEFNRLSKEIIHGTDEERQRCLGIDAKDPWHPSCKELLQRNRKALKEFSSWVEQPSPYNLRTPEGIGRHSRYPIQAEIELTLADPEKNEEDLYPRSQHTALVEMLHLRATHLAKDGQWDQARRDIGHLILIADFLSQSPTMVNLLVSSAYFEMGLRWMNSYTMRRNDLIFYSNLLDKHQLKIDKMSLAIGKEWLFKRYLFTTAMNRVMDEAKESIHPTIWRYLPGANSVTSMFYSERHTLHMAAEQTVADQEFLRGPMLATAYSPAHLSWNDMGWIKYFHNVIGRILLSLSNLKPAKYIAKYARTIDKIAATEIVLAARNYYQANKQWPKQEADMVPRLLPKWPVSLLTGKPLKWNKERTAIVLTELDGSSPCKEQDHCHLTLEPTRNYQ